MTYLIIGIVCSFIIIISYSVVSIGVDLGNNTMTIVSLIFLISSLTVFFVTAGACVTEEVRHPELKYERLLQRIANDNNELRKFYIDHPEFKEQ